MAFTAKDVAQLRERTGCGMMDCKKALTEANGDMDAAIDFLREKGLAAAAKKAEAENITQYASEWKELYEKKEAKVHELDIKIDQLYLEKNEDRERIRDLQAKNAKLELENQALNFKKCEVRGCKDRKPPSNY